MKVVEKTMLCQ